MRERVVERDDDDDDDVTALSRLIVVKKVLRSGRIRSSGTSFKVVYLFPSTFHLILFHYLFNQPLFPPSSFTSSFMCRRFE